MSIIGEFLSYVLKSLLYTSLTIFLLGFIACLIQLQSIVLTQGCILVIL